MAAIDLTPQTLDLTLQQGSTVTLSFQLADATGTPVDLTGKTFRSMARTSYSAASASINFTSAITSASLGQFQLSLTATEFAAVPAGTYVYDIEMVDGTTVTPITKGTLTVSPEATR